MTKKVFKHRVDVLPLSGIPNDEYYIPNGNSNDLDYYVSDNIGNLRFVGTRPGGTSINFADEITLTGVIDGVNRIFTIPHTPTANSIKIYINGQRLKNNYDFTITANTITFLFDIFSDDTLFADYRY